jgi:hypothetical protein
MAKARIVLWLLAIVALAVGSFLVDGLACLGTTLAVAGLLAFQCWFAKKGAVNLDPHILRGPPDGGM